MAAVLPAELIPQASEWVQEQFGPPQEPLDSPFMNNVVDALIARWYEGGVEAFVRHAAEGHGFTTATHPSLHLHRAGA